MNVVKALRNKETVELTPSWNSRGVSGFETGLPNAWLLESKRHTDSRGYFFESFSLRDVPPVVVERPFVQDNVSVSSIGTIRGLHFQRGQHAQAKLVRVLRGAAFDVVVDLRPGSPTYGQWFGVTLSEDNCRSLFVPIGFAHGFFAMVENTTFQYKVTGPYVPEACGGIAWDDPDLDIMWPGVCPDLSDADRRWPRLNEMGADPTDFGRMTMG